MFGAESVPYLGAYIALLPVEKIGPEIPDAEQQAYFAERVLPLVHAGG